jgi:thioredoxin 2
MKSATSQIIQCPECGAKNRIPTDKIEAAAKCGKCHQPLQAGAKKSGGLATYTIRCANCRAKNRIPAGKIDQTANCGKCKSPLETSDLFNGKPVMVTDSNFDGKVINSPLPVLLYCWSPS